MLNAYGIHFGKDVIFFFFFTFMKFNLSPYKTTIFFYPIVITAQIMHSITSGFQYESMASKL